MLNYATRADDAAPLPTTSTLAPTSTTVAPTTTTSPPPTTGVTVTTKAPSKPRPRPTTTTTTIPLPRLVPGTPDELRAQAGEAMTSAILKLQRDIDPLYNRIRNRLRELGVILAMPPSARAHVPDYYARMGWFGYSDAYDVTTPDGVTSCLVTYFPQKGFHYQDGSCG